MKLLFVIAALCMNAAFAHTKDTPGPETYRDLTLKVRSEGHFRIYMPGGTHQDVKYSLKFGAPLFEKPLITDSHQSGSGGHSFMRDYWDKVFLSDESYLEIGNERVPLTCIYINGQDNRFAKRSPLVPEFIMRVYLVANDYSCQGPIRKGWPETGGKKEAWDTYLHYEIQDPTIMLPQDALVRYRWNEASAVLIDEGN